MMKSLFTPFVILLLFWAGSVAGQQVLSDIGFSQCAIRCFSQTVPDRDCWSSGSQECQCPNGKPPPQVTECLINFCTMEDALQIAKLMEQACDFGDDSESTQTIIIISAITAISALSVILRLISRVWAYGSIGADDIVVTIALLFVAAPSTCIIIMAQAGFGEHLWNLQSGQLVESLHLLFITEIFFILILGLVKASMAMTYIKTFEHHAFQVASRITIAIIAIASIGSLFTTVFACKPVAFFWNKDLHGKCLDVRMLFAAQSGLSLAENAILLILPMFMLSKLTMSSMEIISMGVMFMLGLFACVASAMRLWAHVKPEVLDDPTWQYVQVVKFGALELGAVFLVACLPAIRYLFITALPRLFPRLFGHDGASRENSPPLDMIPGSRREKYGSEGMLSWWSIGSQEDLPGWQTDLDLTADIQSLNQHSYPPKTAVRDVGGALPLSYLDPAFSRWGSRSPHSSKISSLRLSERLSARFSSMGSSRISSRISSRVSTPRTSMLPSGLRLKKSESRRTLSIVRSDVSDSTSISYGRVFLDTGSRKSGVSSSGKSVRSTRGRVPSLPLQAFGDFGNFEGLKST